MAWTRAALCGALVLCACAATALCDVYVHGQRGSNNRLNEATTGRANANRLFDSQNNNNGGYNVGEDAGAFYYYEGSVVYVSWTNQHACGPNANTNCELVLQYMCGANLRDGTSTATQGEAGTDADRGLHESAAWYSNCKTRERNKGLFLADQNLKGNTAQYTRQNPNGNRYGLECPEERDYYPYWHPTEWRDIAVMTSNTSRCAYYQAQSQNVLNKGSCSLPAYNRRATCVANSGTWTESGAWGIAAPLCFEAPWSRDNHLGNVREPWEATFNWTVPTLALPNNYHCVLRLRYNISTNDYDGWAINASFNGRDKSPVKQNPVVNFGIRQGLRLAINTAQYGRTFQDRTHTFQIKQRPAALEGKTIYNLNVRGKRGNIVQVYPAVEYDFVPNRLHVRTGDYIHWQWTGSNTNPRGNDGQGTAGTDRSNVVQIASLNYNFPMWASNVTMLPANKINRFATLDTVNDPQLNGADAYFDETPIQMSTPGTYYYMCTRNNNFTNRSQKGTIIVEASA